jgi:hypothetical protein
VSLIIAVSAVSTDAGFDRARYAARQLREIVAPTGAKAARPLDANEGRRLADTVQMLTTDRERLVARLTELEHNVDDITGSITRFENAMRAPAPSVEPLQPISPPAPPLVAMTAPQTVAPPKPAPQPVAPPKPAPQANAVLPPPPAPQPSVTTPFLTPAAARPTDPEVTSSLATPELPSAEPIAPPAAQSNTVTKRQFGLDLGGSPSEEAARANWNVTLRRHGTLLQGLRPVVVTREHARGGVEYRLVAGPISDASRAARFCAAISAMGGVCQPAMYDAPRVAGH